MASILNHPIVTQVACEAKHHIDRADLKTLVKLLSYGESRAAHGNPILSWRTKERMINTQIRKLTRAILKGDHA